MGKEMKEKSSLKRKLPFTVSPSRNVERDSDTEKEGPEKKKMKKEVGNKKSAPFSILFGYPLSERKQMALVMQMTARDNSPDSTPSHPSQTPPTQKRTPSSSSRQKDKVNKRNERGETPLHMAAIRGDVKQVKELISLGANVNVKDFAGWTPLHEACNMGFCDVAKVLIAAGADVNTQGLDDDTPLHDAASSGHKDIVKLLLRHGANAFQSNIRGERPVDVADSKEMEKLLKGDIPISDEEESCTESEPPSVNLSSIDENIDDSETEKESVISDVKVTPRKVQLPAVDEYEFKDDDNEDDRDEEKTSKTLKNRHFFRRERRKGKVSGKNNFFVKQETILFKAFKNKKQKPSRVLFLSSESSDEETVLERKVVLPSGSYSSASEALKNDLRIKKDFSISVENKQKGKAKRKLKNQSKNKENQEIMQEKEGKENSLVVNLISSPVVEPIDVNREEDTFKKAFSPKDDTSLHLFHLSTAKSPKHSFGLSEKHTVPLKQENTKVCLSPGTADVSLSSEVVRYDHNPDLDFNSESSNIKASKHKPKNKHQKDFHVDFLGEKPCPKIREDDFVVSFDSTECILRKPDRDGKVVKKHKLKHKEKEHVKRKKEHDVEKEQHKHKENEQDVQQSIEFDREYWKQNFFKSDETENFSFATHLDSCSFEKNVKIEKTPVKEDVSKEKHVHKERSFKDNKEKEKNKKDKKDKYPREDRVKDVKEDRRESSSGTKESEEHFHLNSSLREEFADIREKDKEIDKVKCDTSEKVVKECKEKSEKKSPIKDKENERADKKHSEKGKKIKHDKSDRERLEVLEYSEKVKEKGSHSVVEKGSRELDKVKSASAVKKLDDKERTTAEKKHEKERTDRDRHASDSKDKHDKEKHGAEKKVRVLEKDTDHGGKLEKQKNKEKEHDKERKKKDKCREKEGTTPNSKVLLEDRKCSTAENSKAVLHEKLPKSKEDTLKSPEAREKEKKEIEKYKERGKHKEKIVNSKINAKGDDDKMKVKPPPVATDNRPKEKRLVNDDLMKTSFERMLSLKDLEIEQWHKKHKEKIKQKERLRHQSVFEQNKKEREKLKNSPVDARSKELLRSKSSEMSEANSKEKILKDATSCRSLSLDAKCLSNSGHPLVGIDHSKSPKPETDKVGLTSRSMSAISVASSEDSCQTAVTTPRLISEYDSDFVLEGFDSQMSVSQPHFLSNIKSPVAYERECDSSSDLIEHIKSPFPNRILPSYLRSASAEDDKIVLHEGKQIAEYRRCSGPATVTEHGKLPQVPVSGLQEDSHQCLSTLPSHASASPKSELSYCVGTEGSLKSSFGSSNLPPTLALSSSVSDASTTENVARDGNFDDITSHSPVQVNASDSHLGGEVGVTQFNRACESSNISDNVSRKYYNSFNSSHCVPGGDNVTEPGISEVVTNQLSAELLFATDAKETPTSLTSKLACSLYKQMLSVSYVSKNGHLISDGSQNGSLSEVQQDTAHVNVSGLDHTDSGDVKEKDMTHLVTENQCHVEGNKCAFSSNFSGQCDHDNEWTARSPVLLQEGGAPCSKSHHLNKDTDKLNVQQLSVALPTLVDSKERESEPSGALHSVSNSAADTSSITTMQEAPWESKSDASSHQVQAVSSSESSSSLVGEISQLPVTTLDNATQPPLQSEQHKSSEAEKLDVEESADDKSDPQEIPQRITRNRANMLANQNKQIPGNYTQMPEKDNDSSATIKVRIRLSEEDDIQVHHPRKRKIPRIPQTVQVNPSLQQAKEKAQQSLAAVVDSLKLEEIQPYHSERANPYYEFLHIRKKVEEKRKLLCSVIPQAPQYYDEYVTLNGSYLLDGNPLSKLCIPTITPPPSLSEPLKDLFRQQELVRMKLRLQHSIEREKLIVSNEQEVLRVHYRAARTLANQALPFSACTVLLDAEVYNMPQDSQGDDSKTSVRDRFNARQFMSWLHDVDDKFDKLKTCLLMRQQHEAAALNAVQRLEWQLKLQELDMSAYKSISIYEVPEFYVPLVEVNDDFELTPI
ncbi:ankyrin repeat domain-containing protein 12 isoform X2 [Protopterus annectens]|uniref:ankyrin repeat domain-containing protein 12 isoform X2 n=1 Tax=Protopterus annectens TaxID=7888 RepID=UPI001CFA230A|nr:ankyrin repeat domain-containing protein 12 isoform X2 [Protopterus annectens]